MTARTSGFTLVEMMVVIVIVSVLSSLLLVSYRGALSKSERQAARTHAAQVGLTVNSYLAGRPNLTASSLTPINCLQAIHLVGTSPYAVAGFSPDNPGWNTPTSNGLSSCTITPYSTYTVKTTVVVNGETVTVDPQ